MTIKAYRSTRYNADRTPKQHKAQPKRSGSIWGVTWAAEDYEDAGWHALSYRHGGRH